MRIGCRRGSAMSSVAVDRESSMNVATRPIAASSAVGLRLDKQLNRLGCLPAEMLEPWGLFDSVSRNRAPVPTALDPIETMLSQLPTGGWSIHPDAARALALVFHAVQPRRVLEFGSGSSTVLLAALCAQAGGGRRVVSLDEKPAYAARTRQLLDAFGLAELATTLVAPVGDGRTGSGAGRTYQPDLDTLRLALAGEPIDFIFVDGPASWLGMRRDCRFGTLPLARFFAAAEAVFVADDALRRRDLSIVLRWQALPYVEVRGIVPIGRGLAVGLLQGGYTR